MLDFVQMRHKIYSENQNSASKLIFNTCRRVHKVDVVSNTLFKLSYKSLPTIWQAENMQNWNFFIQIQK